VPGSAINYSGWLAILDDEALDDVANAAETVLAIHEALANEGISLLGELFRDRDGGPIQAWAHYPPDDCRDPESGAMFYYHAHDPDDWDREEHGHFHLFVRPEVDAGFSHVMAISMTAQGVPHALFATNGWVTDEVMVPAAEVLRLLDERWHIARARPSWLVVQWLTAMVKLLRPHAEALLQCRDGVVGWTAEGKSSSGILDDRNTHVLGEMSLDYMGMLEAIQTEVRDRLNQDSCGARNIQDPALK
jgi:hypothetical protein